MSDSNPKEKVVEEAVIIVMGDQGDPCVMVRSTPGNGSKVKLFRLEPMGFDDVKTFLGDLASGSGQKS